MFDSREVKLSHFVIPATASQSIEQEVAPQKDFQQACPGSQDH